MFDDDPDDCAASPLILPSSWSSEPYFVQKPESDRPEKKSHLLSSACSLLPIHTSLYFLYIVLGFLLAVFGSLLLLCGSWTNSGYFHLFTIVHQGVQVEDVNHKAAVLEFLQVKLINCCSTTQQLNFLNTQLLTCSTSQLLNFSTARLVKCSTAPIFSYPTLAVTFLSLLVYSLTLIFILIFLMFKFPKL